MRAVCAFFRRAFLACPEPLYASRYGRWRRWRSGESEREGVDPRERGCSTAPVKPRWPMECWQTLVNPRITGVAPRAPRISYQSLAILPRQKRRWNSPSGPALAALDSPLATRSLGRSCQQFIKIISFARIISVTYSQQKKNIYIHKQKKIIN